MSLSWTVSQIGPCKHYGVPRGFMYQDRLRLLYTDAWARAGRKLLKKGPAAARDLALRFHPDIPSNRVISFNVKTIADTIFAQPRGDVSTEEQYVDSIRIGQWFAERVSRHFSRQTLDPQLDAFFGFNTGCLETLQMLKDKNIFTIVDQIDPARVEEEIVHRESEKWPGWQKFPGRVPQPYWDRLKAEWDLADAVLVNSDWSRDALIQQGVPVEKLIVVPLGYEPLRSHVPNRKNLDGPLTVLWVGGVTLRKGIQYLCEAAKKLTGTPIRFAVAGPILISDDAVRSAPPNVMFLGRVQRDQTEEMYRNADLFVLPTLSDGFAVTQLEAMAQGLPVITTQNCGKVVTHGVDGLIVPPGDSEALTKAITDLDADRATLQSMSMKALEKSAQFDLRKQAEHVTMRVQEILERRK